jgi:hypothetical protein
MKKLSLVALVAIALGATLFAVPDAMAQIRRNGKIYFGTSDTPVHLGGKLELGDAVLVPTDTSLGVTIDAGVPTSPALTVFGSVTLQGNLTSNSTTQAGTCTLGGQSPSTCTATVRSACRPVCTIQGGSAAIAAKGIACAVSSTTLTATSANAATEVVSYFCF